MRKILLKTSVKASNKVGSRKPMLEYLLCIPRLKRCYDLNKGLRRQCLRVSVQERILLEVTRPAWALETLTATNL